MRKLITIVLLVLSVLLLNDSKSFAQATNLEKYNVTWDSPGMNSAGSMPIGNGDIGVNLWVEEKGDLVFYISKTDAWDENGRLCKIGKVRVKFDPALSVMNGFRQELKLREGIIEIKSKISNQPSTIRLWSDANQPVIHVEAESNFPVNCRAEVELWRLKERPFAKDDDSHSGSGIFQSDFKPTVLPDVIAPSDSLKIVWYHRNTRSVYELGLKTQHLENLKGQFEDPLLNLTFGASLSGKGFARDGNLALKSAVPAKRHLLSITVLTAKSQTPQGWITQLEKVEQMAEKLNPAKALLAHQIWWKSFWERSRIFIDGAPETETVTRGYVLQRFMNCCAGRGGSPIKFNGSIFTNEPKAGDSPGATGIDPDWRRWGGNYWFQNTRLAYWPMLATGDFEMMEPWFRMYLDGLKLSKERIKTYYGFDNAAEFPETMYWWGLPNNGDYGWNNTKPEPANSYISRYWNGSLELIAVMLDRYDFTQDLNFAKNTLVPLADPLISFLDQYWKKRDANGKIIFDPAQSLETWHVAINPLPEIAGLGFLLPRLLALPKTITTESQRSRWKRILQELPPLPTAEVDGVKLLRPAESFSKYSNSENTELYAIFPYRLFGVGHPDLEMARATFNRRKTHHNKGWCQDGIQAACLGLRDEAAKLVAARATNINKDARFPAMWGPNFDWIPDQDHGNNILTSLQFMLIQPVGDKIYLMPAWPKNWNVSFKLHAPKQTTIEGEYRNGKLIKLIVIPKSRLKDVVNMVPE
jgi:alpha-L-fucosidase 2